MTKFSIVLSRKIFLLFNNNFYELREKNIKNNFKFLTLSNSSKIIFTG